jgi:hypothetical protein
MTVANRAHLDGVLDTVRLIDRGSMTENRAALLATRDDGATLLDQVRAFAQALARKRARFAFPDDAQLKAPDSLKARNHALHDLRDV